MGLAIAGTQAIHRNMGVELRSCERSVTEQLLYATKVRAAVEKMGRRAVPETVRAERRSALNPLQGQMHDLPHLPLVDSSPPTAEEGRRRRILPGQPQPAS